MRKTILALSLLLSLCNWTHAGDADALLITDLGSSARMIALGGIEGFTWTSNAVFENPASLAKIKKHSISAFTSKIMDEVTYINLSYATRTKYGQFGLGYMSASVSGIPETGEREIDGQTRYYAIRYFDYLDYLAKLAYQVDIRENLHLGFTANYFNSRLDDLRGSGVNADVGLLWAHDPWTLSATAKNIFINLQKEYTNDATENFPIQLLLGAKYEFRDLDLMAQVKKERLRASALKALGIAYQPSWLPFLKLYAGYKEYFAIRDVESSTTLGVGLSIEGVDFEYGYEASAHPEFDNYNYFSISVNF
jgi:hypothetical protein